MSIKKSLLTSAIVAISTEQVKKQSTSASAPERCKHGVWAADHCYQCEAEQQSPADSDNRCQQVKALESLTAKVARSDKDAERVRDALEVYAESYDMMSRMEGGKVHCTSVACDIRRNMVNAVLKALKAERAPSAKPFAGPGAWFSVDVLGNPMRQYAPGKWESAAWPSDVAGTTATPTDVCAEMRALCSACGGTGDVTTIDGEWRGNCDCEASAWSRATAGNAAPAPVTALDAATFIEKRAEDYLRDNASTESDTGAVAFHYGEAGREYHSTLVELAEEIRGLASNAGAEPGDAEPVAWIRKTDITELTDSEPETNGWTPLYAAPSNPSVGAKEKE